MGDWYDVSGSPGQNASLASATMRTEFVSISTAMSRLPTYTGAGGKLVAVNAGGTALEAVTSGQALTSPVLTTPQINDTSADHQYVFAVSELAADRNITLPLLSADDAFIFAAHAATLTNKTLTAPVIATIVNSGTLTLPTLTTTLVGRSTTDTLTNKTLTAPVIASIVNTGTLTLPTATTTLVGRGTTDTLTNKTLTTPVVTTPDIDGGTIDSAVIGGTTAAAGSFSTLVANNSLTLAGRLVSAIYDTDAMSENSATALVTQQSIKAYVDTQNAAQDLDFIGDSGGAQSVTLDSQTLTMAGGTGIDSTGSANTITLAIDSTVATLTGSQELTNKSLTSPVITASPTAVGATWTNLGTVTTADINGGSIDGTAVGFAAASTGKFTTIEATTSLKLATGATVTALLDEDGMGSNSDTALATQQSIKTYVDDSVTGSLTYQGGYDANTNTPDLDTSPSGISANDFFIVTVAGTFFSTPVNIGDQLIAEQDNPTLESQWTIVAPSLTDAQIKTQYENNADTNEFSDAEQTKLGNAATLTDIQTLSNKTLTLPQINDTSSDHQYVFGVSELVADRTVTLPLLTAADTFVFAAHAQTLTNKTLTAPVISTITNTGTLTLPTATTTLVGRGTTDTLTAKTINLTSNTLSGTTAQFNTALSDGSFATLAGSETLTNKVLTTPTINSPVLTTPQINDTSSDHQYIFAVSELVADRTVTWPLLTGGDTLAFEAHAQTLTNKTIDTASNTITVAEADISDLQSYAVTTNNLSDLSNAGTARSNLGVAIGSNVQAWDADLDTWAGKTPPSGTPVGTTDTQTLTNKTLTLPEINNTAGTFQYVFAVSALAADRTVTLPLLTGADTFTFNAFAATLTNKTINSASNTITVTESTISDLKSYAVTTNNLSDLSNAATARSNLGLVIGTNVQAQDVELSALAGLVSAADRLPYFTGSGTASLAAISAFGRTLIDDADAATARATLAIPGALERQAEKTSGFTAVAGNWYPCDTSGGTFEMTFPVTPSVGAEVGVIDANGTFATNNLTLGRNGSNVMRAAEDGVIDIDNWTTAWVYLDATNGWVPKGF